MLSVVILKKLLYNLMKKIILRLTKGMCQIAKSDVHMKAAPRKSGVMRDRATAGKY